MVQPNLFRTHLRPFTFIHAADLHLGAPFSGLRASHPGVAAAADSATFNAFDRIVELALERRAAFVLFSGDIHNSADRNLKAQLRFHAGVVRLHEAGIPSCIIHGNHDHLGGEQANLKWPESTKIFPAKKDRARIIEVEGEPLAAIHGISYPRREMRESTHQYCDSHADHRELFRVAMLHANVGGLPGHDDYSPCSVEQLKALEIDYWALGHVHSHQVLHRDPAIVYPGSPQGLSIRETGPHGCCVVRVDAQRKCRVEFVPTDGIRWEQTQVSIEGLAGPDELLDHIAGRLERLRAAGEVSYIVRIELTGRGPLHKLLQAENARTELLEDLRSRFMGEPFVWVDQLRLATAPDIDLEARRRSEDLTGDFLRLCQEALADEAERAALAAALHPLFGRPDAKKLLPDPADEILALLAEAEMAGLEKLLGEAPE